MKVGRNDPCPCGSGKKYKQCCEGKPSGGKALFSKGLVALLGVLFVLAAVGFVATLYGNDPSSAGPNRVWSPEHGHWHPVGGQAARGRRVPRPPGAAPAGKVWSPQHGHWHDAR